MHQERCPARLEGACPIAFEEISDNSKPCQAWNRKQGPCRTGMLPACPVGPFQVRERMREKRPDACEKAAQLDLVLKVLLRPSRHRVGCLNDASRSLEARRNATSPCFPGRAHASVHLAASVSFSPEAQGLSNKESANTQTARLPRHGSAPVGLAQPIGFSLIHPHPHSHSPRQAISFTPHAIVAPWR